MKRNLKCNTLRHFLLIIFSFTSYLNLHSQGVTTAQLTGQVVDSKGEPLVAATIQATHVPSGTIYGVYTRDDGRFTIPNMRIGGAYTIKVSYIGFGEKQLDNVFFELGENKKYNFALEESATALAAVEVVAKVGTVGEISGTGTQITSEKISNMPTINRDIDDFLKLTPQATLHSDGISFGGMNNRYNAIYIDGAVNNDVYGLASSGTNGGQTGISPFSIDIIDQLQVVLSPYDVSYGGFAGGGINAVTKSGTNVFSGTAYYFNQNENLTGKSNKKYAEKFKLPRVKLNPYSESTYGFSLGGPIKKNKLFFFANVEIQRDESPLPYDIEAYTGNSSQEDIEGLRQFLLSEYGYDAGTFGSTTENLDGLKLFGKLDYNLNENHRLTLRHNYTKAEQFDHTTRSNNIVFFTNNAIYFPSITNSSALELNSRFKNNYSNNLILGYTTVRDDRDPYGSNFPFVIINDGLGSIRFGSDENSNANALNQNIFTITDNFRIYNGAHTFTIGTHNEFYDIYNLFIGRNFGTYTYDSLSVFLNEGKASAYDRSYSLVDSLTGDGSKAAAEFTAMQLGFYVQDEWQVTRKFNVSAGLRLDIPVINSDPAVDTFFNNTVLPKLKAKNVLANELQSGKAPDGQLMWSPRIGFTYDVQDNKKYMIRGGVGIFTSRIPFVWPGAMFTNNGLTIGRVTQADLPGGVFFEPNINEQPTNANFKIPSGQYDLFGKDFKYPQVFKTNIAFDTRLPFGINFTLEGIYTKILNNVVYSQINNDTTGSFQWTSSADNRTIYPRKAIESTYGGGIFVASNTDEGDAYTITASFAKRFNFGLSAILSYTYGDANSLMDGTSSQNSSQWRGQINHNGRNNPSYGRADFAIGHRLISNLSYKINWGGSSKYATTLSLFYEGKTGSPYSYVIAGSKAQNLNNEFASSGSTNRNRSLIYIPKDQSEINLISYTVSGTTFTPEEQWNRLNSFIASDEYLSSHRGEYAEKNSNFMPFTSFVDLAIKQDIGFNIKGKMHIIQLSADIFNFMNLLNSQWGVRYTVPGGDFNNYQLYTFEGLVADANNANKVTKPTFTYRGGGESGKASLDILNAASRWEMRLGVRYIF